MSLHYQDVVNNPNLTIIEPRSGEQASWRHFSHNHSLFYYPQHDVRMKSEEASGICPLWREVLSGPVYGCSRCGFYLHDSCAQLPHTIKFGRLKFVLEPTSGKEIVESREYLICYGRSGVLYSFSSYHDFKCQIHPKCAKLPYKLKHSCHEHILELWFAPGVYVCSACGAYGNAAGYCCKECGFYFHIMCTLYLEARVVHVRHGHPLVLCTIPRDKRGDEYYCEICGTERLPDLWAYYCKPCEYEAHISCMNPRVKPCHPEVLLPENRAEGKINQLLKPYKNLPGLRNPILSEISVSQIAWEPVDENEA